MGTIDDGTVKDELNAYLRNLGLAETDIEAIYVDVRTKDEEYGSKPERFEVFDEHRDGHHLNRKLTDGDFKRLVVYTTQYILTNTMDSEGYYEWFLHIPRNPPSTTA